MRSAMQKLGRGVFAAATVGVCIVGLSATSQPAHAAKPCPNNYLPVRCDDGKVYRNPCLADRAGATGCVPIGVLPP